MKKLKSLYRNIRIWWFKERVLCYVPLIKQKRFPKRIPIPCAECGEKKRMSLRVFLNREEWVCRECGVISRIARPIRI